MEALEAILTRRSTRKYQPELPDQLLIEKVIEAGRYAPSGGNSQTTHFIIITKPDILDEIAWIVQTAFAKMQIQPNTYQSLQNSINASKRGNYIFHYNTPVLIVTANKKGYGNAMADSACALENMMIAANALDLGSCWINQLKWLNENPVITEYLRGIGLEEGERVYGALALGYAKDGLPNRSPLPRTGNPVTYVD